MMRSMTGYGSAELQTRNFHIKVELKSLNGKFLELNLRSPKFLGEKEVEIRKYLNAVLTRGSVLCTITMDKSANAEYDVNLNRVLASAYYEEMKSLAEELNAPDHDIFRTIMTMPDVLKQEDGNLEEEDWEGLMTCCKEAFEKLDRFRVQEGEELRQLLMRHNNIILELLPQVEPLEEERKIIVKERLKSGLGELAKDINADINRLEQEMIYYLEKLDITEEKNRLSAHCVLFNTELQKADNGKKLGFISQEMGREINTLGSKANYAPIQEIVIGMKEELEKIKEQALNVL